MVGEIVFSVKRKLIMNKDCCVIEIPDRGLAGLPFVKNGILVGFGGAQAQGPVVPPWSPQPIVRPVARPESAKRLSAS